MMFWMSSEKFLSPESARIAFATSLSISLNFSTAATATASTAAASTATYPEMFARIHSAHIGTASRKYLR